MKRMITLWGTPLTKHKHKQHEQTHSMRLSMLRKSKKRKRQSDLSLRETTHEAKGITLGGTHFSLMRTALCNAQMQPTCNLYAMQHFPSSFQLYSHLYGSILFSTPLTSFSPFNYLFYSSLYSANRITPEDVVVCLQQFSSLHFASIHICVSICNEWAWYDTAMSMMAEVFATTRHWGKQDPEGGKGRDLTWRTLSKMCSPPGRVHELCRPVR